MSGNDNNSTSSSHEPFTTATAATTVEIGSASSNKRKRRPAGTPDPDAEVVSLSPKTLLESDRYVCEICNQGFQRDQNLQMHRRRHKVPWKLLKRENPVVKKRVFVCPEPTCLHHDPCHALGDLVGIKKHFRRKHSNHKQWVCDKCSKAYAVQSDYKAHQKTCGTRGHSCDCGRVFSRVESFIEHQDACLRPESHSTIMHPTVCLSRTASSPSPSNDIAPWTSGLVLPRQTPTDNNNDNNAYDSLVGKGDRASTNSNNVVNISDANIDGTVPTASNCMVPSKMMATMMKKQKSITPQQQNSSHRLELRLLTMNPQDEDAVAISDENHSTTQLQLSIGSSDHVGDYRNELSSNIAISDKKLDRHSSSTTTTATATTAVAVAAANNDKSSTASLMMLKEEASEQFKLAIAEKAYAEKARKEAKRQIEMAEGEFANAKRIRQQAQVELDKAQELKNHAMKQITCTLLQITCHSCKRQFQATTTTTSTGMAATIAPAVSSAIAADHVGDPNSLGLNYNITSSSPNALDTNDPDDEENRS